MRILKIKGTGTGRSGAALYCRYKFIEKQKVYTPESTTLVVF